MLGFLQLLLFFLKNNAILFNELNIFSNFYLKEIVHIAAVFGFEIYNAEFDEFSKGG